LRHYRTAASPSARHQRDAGSQAHDATAEKSWRAWRDAIAQHLDSVSRQERKGRKERQVHCSVALGVKKRVLMRSSTKAHTLLYEGARSVLTKERTAPMCARRLDGLACRAAREKPWWVPASPDRVPVVDVGGLSARHLRQAGKLAASPNRRKPSSRHQQSAESQAHDATPGSSWRPLRDARAVSRQERKGRKGLQWEEQGFGI